MVQRQKGALIRGKVRKFSGRGKKIGFPTANLNLTRPIPEGVYFSIVKINNLKYQALTFIGRPKTFNDLRPRVEVHVPDFKKNLSDQWISVKLLTKIRGIKKFKNKQELIKQINKDLHVFRNYSISPTNY